MEHKGTQKGQLTQRFTQEQRQQEKRQKEITPADRLPARAPWGSARPWSRAPERGSWRPGACPPPVGSACRARCSSAPAGSSPRAPAATPAAASQRTTTFWRFHFHWTTKGKGRGVGCEKVQKGEGEEGSSSGLAGCLYNHGDYNGGSSNSGVSSCKQLLSPNFQIARLDLEIIKKKHYSRELFEPWESYF